MLLSMVLRRLFSLWQELLFATLSPSIQSFATVPCPAGGPFAATAAGRPFLPRETTGDDEALAGFYSGWRGLLRPRPPPATLARAGPGLRLVWRDQGKGARGFQGLAAQAEAGASYGRLVCAHADEGGVSGKSITELIIVT